MSEDFASSRYTVGQLNAIVKRMVKTCGQDAPERFLRGELTIATRWVEKAGIIYFSVTSDGKTGPEWIAHFENKGCNLGYNVRRVLCSSDFVPTSGVTCQVAVLKGIIFGDDKRTATNISAEASIRNLIKPQAEIGCLIRDNFSDSDITVMGLTSIITMHEPIENSGNLFLLHTGNADNSLSTYYYHPTVTFRSSCGFAFVVSQVCAQS